MAILVTGGAGFIGSHLIERLLAETDATIVCLDNFNDYYDPLLKRANAARLAQSSRVVVVEASFCDAPAMEELFGRHQIEQVIHLGAYAGVRYSVQNPMPYQQANVEGTLVLLEVVRRHPVRRFLYASSSTVYGGDAEVPFSESRPLGIPMSPYGVTKRAGELLCLTYHDLFEVPAVCLRLFSVYGPRLRPDLAMTIFTAAIEDGSPLPLFGDGSIRRDFTHVSDICRGMLSALNSTDAPGECINLGHNEPVEIRRLIGMLEEATGKQANIDHRPARAEDMPITCADLAKARRLLDYQPRVPFSDGVPEFVEWFREYRQASDR